MSTSPIELRTLRVYVYDGYRCINQEMDLYTIKILTSLPVFGSILKYFGEPVSIGVKVVLLVEDDTTGKHLYPYIESRTLRVYMYAHYGKVNEEMDFHITGN